MSVLCRKGSFSDSQPLAIISPGNTVNWSPWSLMLLDGGLGRVLPSMKCRHSLCRWCTWIEFILNEHKVTALCCQKLGGWVPGKCHMFACYLLVREENFHSTLEVRVLAAALYQLMVMLGLDGYLVTGCPHTMGLTLGAKFVLQVLSLPLLGNGSCSGPMVGVDRKLWNWQLGWKEWYLFCIQLTNNDHQNERRERKKIIMKVKGRTLQWTRANLKQ